MQLDILDEAFEKLFSRDEPFVATLDGKWGVGKTHYWKNLIEKDNIKKDKTFAYVSLFGKESLQDIKTDIIIQISTKTKHIENLKSGFDNLKSNIGLKDEDMNFGLTGSFISSALTLLSKKDFEKVIICFDDFERLSDKLKPKDILGLISELKEQKECKVVMILNQDKLDKDSDIKEYKDKIIDYNFEYKPTPEQSFNLVKDELKAFKNYPLEYFQKQNINNIRVIKSVIRALNDFDFIEESLKEHKDLEQRVVFTIISMATVNAENFDFDLKKIYEYKEKKVLKESNRELKKEIPFEEDENLELVLKRLFLQIFTNKFDDEIAFFISKYIKNQIVYEEYKEEFIDFIKNKIKNLKIDEEFFKLGYDLNQLSIYNSYRFDYFNKNYIVDAYNLIKQNIEKFYLSLNRAIELTRHLNDLINLDKDNEKKYRDFGITHLKKYIDRDKIKNFDINSKDKLNRNIFKFDSCLKEYYLNKNISRINTSQEAINLMKECLRSYYENKYDESITVSLLTIKEEKLRGFILNDFNFIEEFMYFGENNIIESFDKNFNKFKNRVIKVLKELQNENDEYREKIDNIFKQIKYREN